MYAVKVGNSSIMCLRFVSDFVSDPSNKNPKNYSVKISEKILKKKIRDKFQLSRSFKIDFFFLPERPLSIYVYHVSESTKIREGNR